MNIVQLIQEGKFSKAKEEIEKSLQERKNTALINEKRQIKIKVTSKGKRRRKLVCGKGMKSVDGKCVPQSSQEKLSRKKGLRQASKTKRAAGAGQKRKSGILRKKAMKKRKSMGL